MVLERKKVKLSNITKRQLTKSLMMNFIRFTNKHYSSESENYALMILSGGKTLKTGYCEPELEFIALSNSDNYSVPMYADVVTRLTCEECHSVHKESFCDFKTKKLSDIYSEKIKNITLPLLESTCVGDIIQLDLSTFTINESYLVGILDEYRERENRKQQIIAYQNKSKELLSLLKSVDYTFVITHYTNSHVGLTPSMETCNLTNAHYNQINIEVPAVNLSKHFKVVKENTEIHENRKKYPENLSGFNFYAYYGL